MKISELIKELEKIQSEHGDLQVEHWMRDSQGYMMPVFLEKEHLYLTDHPNSLEILDSD